MIWNKRERERERGREKKIKRVERGKGYIIGDRSYGITIEINNDGNVSRFLCE